MKPEPLKGKIVFWYKIRGFIETSDNKRFDVGNGCDIKSIFFFDDVKSAVQGLLIDMEVTDLDEIVCSDGSHRRMDEKTRKRIITDLIKKWFPDMVSENE